jgi:hypothetical protein
MNAKKCEIGKSKASLTERVVSNYVQSVMLTPSWGTRDDSSLHGLRLFVTVYKRARHCPLLREEGLPYTFKPQSQAAVCSPLLSCVAVKHRREDLVARRNVGNKKSCTGTTNCGLVISVWPSCDEHELTEP